MKRNYISIYFPYVNDTGEKKVKNLCIAFSEKEDGLYEKMKSVKTGVIKKKISIHSYTQLLKTAQAENRKPSEIIKQRFIEKASNRRREKVRTLKIDSKQVLLWIRSLKKKDNPDLISFLKSLL